MGATLENCRVLDLAFAPYFPETVPGAPPRLFRKCGFSTGYERILRKCGFYRTYGRFTLLPPKNEKRRQPGAPPLHFQQAEYNTNTRFVK
jgi:hypothetical protein